MFRVSALSFIRANFSNFAIDANIKSFQGWPAATQVCHNPLL